MFRNEFSILGAFLDQVGEFFDTGALVDHESTDASAEFVKSILPAKFSLLHLKARGYPQAEIATFCAKRLFAESDVDWVFFLDCDEFLPFANRAALVDRLSGLDADVVTLRWRNVVPREIDGGNIFAGPFEESGVLSNFSKIAISRQVFERDADTRILQGYHSVTSAAPLRSIELSGEGLIHIPVQSKLRFALKIKRSAEKLIAERNLLSKGLGSHWIDYYNLIKQQGVAQFDFKSAALAYPEGLVERHIETRQLPFTFDYIRTPWTENSEGFISDLYQSNEGSRTSSRFTLYNDDEILLRQDDLEPVAATNTVLPDASEVGLELSSLFGDFYADVVEPLFSLPLKMPLTAWGGHIPFLFVLIRLLRPKSYVDLGVHAGASLIAAATAAKAYQVPANLYGIDTWEGDPHAGFYDGDVMYQDLKVFMEHQFSGVHLVRRLFDDALELFAPGSIELLHVDGLHTYEAVKHDFLTWFPKLSPSGVIMFHDTAVHDRGFGVFRLLRELKEQFTTMEFFQSHGLGVLFLDPEDERIQPLVSILRNPDAMMFYQALVADIASLLPSRMQHLEERTSHRSQELRLTQEIHSLEAELVRYRGLAETAISRTSMLERELAYSRIASRALKLEISYAGSRKRFS
jgi:hypothetical protein